MTIITHHLYPLIVPLTHHSLVSWYVYTDSRDAHEQPAEWTTVTKEKRTKVCQQTF
jgi:hypothetical protein